MPHILATGKPTLGVYPEWARAGLLLTYSTDAMDGFRRAGAYAAKIVRGAKPGDLPIEQASKFWLVVNLKAARQLGIKVSSDLLTLADEVIENRRETGNDDGGVGCGKTTRRANHQKPVHPFAQKYSAFPVGQISATSSRRLTR